MDKFKYMIDEEIDIHQVKSLFKDITKPILVVGIGTPKIILDSVGPYTASALQVRGFKVRGTMNTPIHALNIRKFTKSINLEDYFVIALDASVGSNIGSIIIKPGSIHPGAAAGKLLPHIGNISIKFIVAQPEDFLDKSPEAINNALGNDPNNLRDMFRDKIVKMFKQLRKEGLI